MKLPYRAGATIMTATLAVLWAAPAGAETRVSSASASLGDLTGDVVDVSDETPLAEPRADIISAAARYDDDELGFSLQVARPTDPAQDAGWTAPTTSASWAIDVDGDSYMDYLALLTTDGLGTLIGGVVDSTDAGDLLCFGDVSYSAADGYSMVFDPTCIGAPGQILWGAIMLYTADPNDPQAPVALDYTPNSDTMAGPLSRPSGGGFGTAGSRSGYWMVTAAGEVFDFGDAGFYGDHDLLAPGASVVDLEPTPSKKGYWTVDSAGYVTASGDAAYLGDRVPLHPGEQVTSLSSTRTGDGYWLFTSQGRVFSFGNAQFYGSLEGVPLNGPILDSIPTTSGLGYYMVGSDGGIFTFGDAVFIGSMGDTPLNAPVQSLVPDSDGTGYWLVASDGGIFTFEAVFRGSLADVNLNRPITGMVPYGDGYLMVGEDGGIFNFSNLSFDGSLGDNPPASPVVSVAALA